MNMYFETLTIVELTTDGLLIGFSGQLPVASLPVAVVQVCLYGDLS